MKKDLSLVNILNKTIPSEFPVIKKVEMVNKKIYDGFIDFKFVLFLTKDDLFKILGITDDSLILDLIFKNDEVNDFWFKYKVTDNFDYKTIRHRLKNICKFYYNEKIQNFDVVIKLL
jgi:hypothetical protein